VSKNKFICFCDIQGKEARHQGPAILILLWRKILILKNINNKFSGGEKQMVKIRLQRQGAKKAPFYHIVVADSKSPRDGKIIEKIGSYDPMTEPSTIILDDEKLATWIKNGAKPTESVKELIERASKK
jgi:small subunit ribosomal protein S16